MKGRELRGRREMERKGVGISKLNEVTGSLDTYNEPCTLNCEYSRELNRFIPLKPWQGGPPQRSSTSLFWGRTCPLELVVEPCREGRGGEGGEERRGEERRGEERRGEERRGKERRGEERREERGGEGRGGERRGEERRGEERRGEERRGEERGGEGRGEERRGEERGKEEWRG